MDGEKIENQDFQVSAPLKGDYENCSFINCNFSNADLSEINFLECEFLNCNLSLTGIPQTSFRDVIFKNCKIVGLHFEESNSLLMSFTFEGCTIELCSFNKLKLKKTVFRNARITEADFTETDLSYSKFISCDLQRTIFFQSNLEGVDFRTSFNYIIDPEQNRIRKAKFSLSGLVGLLAKYDIEIE